VATQPDGTGARDIAVSPIDDETQLRRYAWVENNRRIVDSLTNGRVAYVYLSDVATDGYLAFNRQYFAQVDKKAVIIDERYNSGGYWPDYILEQLDRRLLGYWNVPEGKDITSPQLAIFGPKVMLINEMAGSGGDLLPWLFQHQGAGPLIGKRTWGAGGGSYSNPRDLLDGGVVGINSMSFYDRTGNWDIENRGVAPDIDVENDPKAARAGHDLQLERAVEVVLGLMRKDPNQLTTQHPPYPNYNSSVLESSAARPGATK
jgi:tricorn protease